MSKHSFSRFAYLDTNIISHLSKNRNCWPGLAKFCSQNDITIGISDTAISELSDANRLHNDLVVLLMRVPSAILKNQHTILEEEVKAYPKMRTEILGYPLNSILLENNGIDRFRNFLSSHKLKNARGNQLDCAKQMPDKLTQLKNNFQPSKSGKYTRNQAEEFVWRIIVQILGYSHRAFLLQFKNSSLDKHLNTEVFKSISLYAYVMFYKYYLGRREPSKRSDFADLGHLFHIPYCKYVVIENDLCNILNQIKKNHEILGGVEIKNIKFVKEPNQNK